VRNTTLDFIRVVARLYLNRKAHRSIALKQIDFLNEFLRNRFQIPSQPPDKKWVERVAERTGASAESVDLLAQSVRKVLQSGQIEPELLFELDSRITEFYRQVRGQVTAKSESARPSFLKAGWD
jgi:hypothetical protein